MTHAVVVILLLHFGSTIASCPGGKYAVAGGGGDCEKCPKGRFLGDGATGQRQSADDDAWWTPPCTPCPAGQYADQTGLTACKLCQPGRFSTWAGNTECDRCESGKFSRPGTPGDSTGSCDQEVCEGKLSQKLPEFECFAWRRGYDSMGGAHWTDCQDSRNDPCSCSAVTCEKVSQNYCSAGVRLAPLKGLGYAACVVLSARLASINEPDVGMFALPTRTSALSIGASFALCGATGVGAEQCTGYRITRIELRGHNLVGTLPEEWSLRNGYQFAELAHIDLENNALHGSIPTPFPVKSCKLKGNNFGCHQDDSVAVGCFSGETSTCCPKGKYFKSHKCKDCPPGKYTDQEALQSCKGSLCSPGRYSEPRQRSPVVCEKCKAGTYVAAPGSTSCSACSPGYKAPLDGALQCFACAPGYYAGQDKSTICNACVSGEFTDLNASTACRQCEAGRYARSPAAQKCASCEAGKFNTAKASKACTECERGKFAQSTSSTKCDVCEIGRIAPRAGTDLCEDCPAGRFAAQSGATHCTACPPGGQYQDQRGQGTCKGQAGCPRNQFFPSEAQIAQPECKDCPGGKYQDQRGQPACIQYAGKCDNGELIGLQQRRQHNHCGKCVQGFGLNETNGCEACSFVAGRFSTAFDGSPCQEHHVCEAGEYESNAPQKNVVGNGVTDRTCRSHTVCADGKTAGVPAERESKPPQHVSGAGTLTDRECEACHTGYACNGTALMREVQCDNGKVKGDRSHCDCNAGYYGKGVFDVITREYSVCHHCETGRYGHLPGQKDQTACKPCPAARYNDQVAQVSQTTACKLCAKGKYGDVVGAGSENAGCKNCAEGQYAEEKATQNCKGCTPGRTKIRYKSGAKALDEACRPDCRQRPFSVLDSENICRCMPGYYETQAQETPCRACEPGQWQDAIGQEKCNGSLCKAGTFAKSMKTREQDAVCEKCPEGQYQENEGQEQCKPCPSTHTGQKQGTGAKRMEDACEAQGRICDFPGRQILDGVSGICICKAGFSSGIITNRDDHNCSACTPGQYQDEAGQPACKGQPCERGKFGPRQKASAETAVCQDCPAGKFASNVGQHECESCPLGRISLTEGRGATSPEDACAFPPRDCSVELENSVLNKVSGECACTPGYFYDPQGNALKSRRKTCQKMPALGATCGNVTLDCSPRNFVVQQGFWRTRAASKIVLACPESGSCLGNGQCAEGHTGPLCTVCRRGWSRKFGGNNKCEKCSDAEAVLFFGMSCLVVLIVFFFLPRKLWRTKNRNGKAQCMLLIKKVSKNPLSKRNSTPEVSSVTSVANPNPILRRKSAVVETSTRPNCHNQGNELQGSNYFEERKYCIEVELNQKPTKSQCAFMKNEMDLKCFATEEAHDPDTKCSDIVGWVWKECDIVGSGTGGKGIETGKAPERMENLRLASDGKIKDQPFSCKVKFVGSNEEHERSRAEIRIIKHLVPEQYLFRYDVQGLDHIDFDIFEEQQKFEEEQRQQKQSKKDDENAPVAPVNKTYYISQKHIVGESAQARYANALARKMLLGGDDGEAQKAGWEKLKVLVQPCLNQVTVVMQGLWSNKQVHTSLKILIMFMQVLSQLHVVYDIPFPEQFVRFTQLLALFNFEFMTFFSAGCVANFTFVGSLIITTLAPIVLALVAQGFVALMRSPVTDKDRLLGRFFTAAFGKRPGHDDKTGKTMKRLARHATYFCMFLSFLVFPGVSTTVFRAYPCRDFDYDQSESNWRLKADLSIECRNKFQARDFVFGWALIMTLMYPIGIPMYYYYCCNLRDGALDTMKVHQRARRRSIQVSAVRDVHKRLQHDKPRAHQGNQVEDEQLVQVAQQKALGYRRQSVKPIGHLRGGSELSLSGGDSKSNSHVSESMCPWIKRKGKTDSESNRSERTPSLAWSKKVEANNSVYFLGEPYSVECCNWFEVFECFRRLMLTGGSVFFLDGSATQVSVGILTSVLSIFVYAHCDPFLDRRDYYLAVTAQGSIFLTLFEGMILKTGAADEDNYSKDALAWVLILINLGVVVLAFYDIKQKSNMGDDIKQKSNVGDEVEKVSDNWQRQPTMLSRQSTVIGESIRSTLPTVFEDSTVNPVHSSSAPRATSDTPREHL